MQFFKIHGSIRSVSLNLQTSIALLDILLLISSLILLKSGSIFYKIWSFEIYWDIFRGLFWWLFHVHWKRTYIWLVWDVLFYQCQIGQGDHLYCSNIFICKEFWTNCFICYWERGVKLFNCDVCLFISFSIFVKRLLWASTLPYHLAKSTHLEKFLFMSGNPLYFEVYFVSVKCSYTRFLKLLFSLCIFFRFLLLSFQCLSI